MEYEFESEKSMGSTLPLYTSPPPPPLPPSDSPLPYPTMSQNELHTIICQQQEQLAVIQAQIQALLAAGEGATAGPHVEVAKPAIFSGEAGKVGGFVNACKLYIRMKMGGAMVVEQVYWILSHVQGGSADI